MKKAAALMLSLALFGCGHRFPSGSIVCVAAICIDPQVNPPPSAASAPKGNE